MATIKSIEEKAKAYDEAIEYAHHLINEQCKEGTDGSFHRADLHKMFPALIESEDERIRKAIIQFFELQDDNTTYSFIPKKDILAWLEKQGEQKPADEVGNYDHKEVLQTIINEQKSAELSEEIPTDLKDIVDNEANAIWKEESSDGCHLVIDSFNMFFGICMQIAETVVDYRKPVEWSEEVESAISLLKDIAEEQEKDYCQYNANNLRKAAQYLETCRPQNHNKWHSIDEKPVYPCNILYKAPNGNIFLFKYMENGKPDGPETRYLHSFDDGEWMYLKDIESQSHWKPSEEQMKALEHAISCYSGISPTNGHEVFILEIMKERLKKLK